MQKKEESRWDRWNRLVKNRLRIKADMRRYFRDRYKGRRTHGHSLGPWDLSKDDQGGFYDRSSVGLCFEAGHRAGQRYCKDDARWHHNAMLIEASPVLYEELKNLIKKIESSGVSQDDLEGAKKAIELAHYSTEVKFEEVK